MTRKKTPAQPIGSVYTAGVTISKEVTTGSGWQKIGSCMDTPNAINAWVIAHWAKHPTDVLWVRGPFHTIEQLNKTAETRKWAHNPVNPATQKKPTAPDTGISPEIARLYR